MPVYFYCCVLHQNSSNRLHSPRLSEHSYLLAISVDMCNAFRLDLKQETMRVFTLCITFFLKTKWISMYAIIFPSTILNIQFKPLLLLN